MILRVRALRLRIRVGGARQLLRRALRSEQLLDLTMLAGRYRAIAYTANAAGIALESWAARFPRAREPA